VREGLVLEYPDRGLFYISKRRYENMVSRGEEYSAIQSKFSDEFLQEIADGLEWWADWRAIHRPERPKRERVPKAGPA
jgi:hypothetical protein